MARNEEKAQSMLNRWITYKHNLSRGYTGKPEEEKRPHLASSCGTIGECEKWRMQILRDIGKKVMDIQNESLGEQRIRDLNDDINKLLREKGHWERRIMELGGPNYRKYERAADDAFLAELNPEESRIPDKEQKGYTYKYFGAAKNLPGVRELFQKKPEASKRQRYANQVRGIDAEYYGYRDVEGDNLENFEKEAEKKALTQAIKNWEKEQQNKAEGGGEAELEGDSLEEGLPVPTKQQMEKALVDRRKQEMMKRYVSEELKTSLDAQKQEVEVVLGKRKH